MKRPRVAAHSLDRYNKVKAMILEGATVVAACKRCRLAPTVFFRIRRALRAASHRGIFIPATIQPEKP